MLDATTLATLGAALADAKPVLTVLHFFAMAVGVGAACLTDVLVIRLLSRRRVRMEDLAVLYSAHRLILAAVILIWVTGELHMVRLLLTDPATLQNPKIWAKVVVFAVISVNGFAIQRWCIPWVRSRLGRPLLYQSEWRHRFGLAATGAISVTSWFYVLALGALREVNFIVSLQLLLGVYVILVAGALGVSSIVMTKTALRPSAEATLARKRDSFDDMQPEEEPTIV